MIIILQKWGSSPSTQKSRAPPLFFGAINSNLFMTVPGRVVNELIATWCASIEGYLFIKIIPYNTHFGIKVLCLEVKVNSSMLLKA